jgi:hypothetical protein
MSVIDMEIHPRPASPVTGEPAAESERVVLLDDLDALGDGSAAACNDDNPYQGS